MAYTGILRHISHHRHTFSGTSEFQYEHGMARAVERHVRQRRDARPQCNDGPMAWADADYGGFSAFTHREPPPRPRSVEMGYDVLVPHEATRDVTPPQMRVAGPRRATLLHAYEDAFMHAAPQPGPPPDGGGSDDGMAACPIFSTAHTADANGARRRIILDEQGAEIRWPWEGGREEPPPDGMQPGEAGARDIVAERYFAEAGPQHDHLGTHAADKLVQAGLDAATGDGRSGENSTGVRAYKRFCSKHRRAALRPIDPNAPLWVKLSEETWSMRFIAEIVEDRSTKVDTARGYFGAANKWHLRKTGIGFAAGMDLKRMAEMVKGLKNLRDGPPQQMRRGMSPQQLRTAMDIVFPPVSAENCNIRAMLATGLQGLMRGRELGCDGRFDSNLDLARGDISTISADRFAFFMRPAKNMRHRRGKTVPLVVGGGGMFIDACVEVQRMLEFDPTPPTQASYTPMFRKPDGSAFTTDDIRAIVRQLAVAINEDPLMFGAHSLRIGGATALFAAGADPLHIRTMGRWSSDCYRLYVRACFEQTLDWTRRLGSQRVHDVQGTYERRAQEVEEY